mgnify:CR=1 FL=1
MPGPVGDHQRGMIDQKAVPLMHAARMIPPAEANIAIAGQNNRAVPLNILGAPVAALVQAGKNAAEL